MSEVKPKFRRKPNMHAPLMRGVHMDLLLDNFKIVDSTGNVPDSLLSLSGSGFTLGLGPAGRALVFDRSASNQVDIADDVTDAQFPDGRSEFSMMYYFTFTGADDSNEYTLGNNATTLGTTTDVSGTLDVGDGKPHMLLITRDTSIAVSYMDGEQLASQSSPGSSENETYLFRYRADSQTWNLWMSDTSGQTDTMIGGTQQKTTDRWQGQIHRVVYFNRALSAREAMQAAKNPWFGYETPILSLGLSTVAEAADATGYPGHFVNKLNVVRSKYV